MSKEIIVRLSSSAGRSRLSVPADATLGDLQAKVQTATGVDAASQKLAFDPAGRQVVAGTASSSVASLNIVNGTQLHLIGGDAKMDGQVLTKVPVPVDAEPKVPAAGAAGAVAPAGAAAASSGSAGAPAAAPVAADSVKDKADPKKQPDKVAVDADGNKLFDVFDRYIRDRRYETSNLQGAAVHISTPLKAGGMIKIPPSVSIKQQPYRHIDQVSVNNRDEYQNFASYWIYDLLPEAQQRVGWMYGYYLADHRYGEKEYCEGTRAVVEAIYEPPQQMIDGEVVMQDDPDLALVEKVAAALGLERVGHIFTSFPLDDRQLLTPQEVLKIARYQQQFSTDAHFTKYCLSKFVSSSVRPDPKNDGAPDMRSYMVSDQAVAMVRDNVLLEDSTERGKLTVRKPQKGELLNHFLVESKEADHIETEWFVVNLVDALPKKPITMFKHADFPRENRPGRPQQRDELKKYFKKRSSSEASWSRFADFHLLLYIAKVLDVDTAIQLCECVRDQKEISEGTKMLFESLIG